MLKNGLIRKIRVISKFIILQPGKQTIAIHILPNISRSIGNRTMKFSQLVENSKSNIFLEKSYTKCCGETILRLISKKIKIKHISGSIVESFIQFIFNIYPVESCRNILKLSSIPLTFTSIKLF